MSFSPISQLLQQINSKPRWRKHQRLAVILNHWQELVGQNVAKQTRPTGIYQEVLQVATSSAVWCHELSAQRSPILHKINQLLAPAYSQELLKDIHFSTARWQEATAQSKVFLPHLAKPQPLPPSLPPPADPLSALQRWREALAQQKHSHCPRCQRQTSPADLERWGICRFCARLRFLRQQ